MRSFYGDRPLSVFLSLFGYQSQAPASCSTVPSQPTSLLQCAYTAASYLNEKTPPALSDVARIWRDAGAEEAHADKALKFGRGR